MGRCTETGFLEFHHVVPFAEGGETTVANLELRCRAHNAYEAEQWFGARQPPLLREARVEYGERELGPDRVHRSHRETRKDFACRRIAARTGLQLAHALERAMQQECGCYGDKSIKPYRFRLRSPLRIWRNYAAISTTLDEQFVDFVGDVDDFGKQEVHQVKQPDRSNDDERHSRQVSTI